MFDRLNFRQECPRDYDGIDQVHHLAFGQPGEGQLVRALRDQELSVPELSIVAVKERRVIGHIFYSLLPISHIGGTVQVLALAPMAVLPEFQGKGIGSELVRRSLARAQEIEFPAVLVLGDPKYYSRFGFNTELGARVKSPYNGSHFMGLNLRDGALQSLVGAEAKYPEAFSLV